MPINYLNLAKEYGTPLYVYNADIMLERLADLRKAFPAKNLQILFAMKANYCPALLKILHEAGAWVDTVSPGDVQMAKACGFDVKQMLYTVNNINDTEMHFMHKEGVLFNIDSLSRLDKYGKAYPNARVCLRFNPNVVAGGNAKIQTGGKKTKFGLRLSELEDVLKVVREHQLKVVGIHKHTGSEIREADDFMQAVDKLIGIATKDNFPDLEFIDFGGGFGVPYRPEQTHIDLALLGSKLMPRFHELCQHYQKDLGLYFEPGKFLSAECGTLIVEVNTIKVADGYNFVGTDSGFNHLIRPVLYDAYHPIENLSNPNGKANTYEVMGNICETGDWFAQGRSLPEIREGDLLAIKNAGAYCYSMGSLYNLRSMPAEVVVHDGKAKLARERETSDELIKMILTRYR
jgi:diaminopimelate decarboxylase